MSEKPKRFGGLGWIEVENLRPQDTDPGYSGTWYLNLDLVKQIHLPENQPGVAIVHFLDGRSESLEEGNHSRLLKAIDKARLD